MSAANPPESLSWTFLRAHPEDAARVLEGLPPADVVALMQALPARITARALSNLRPSLAAAVLHGVASASHWADTGTVVSGVACAMRMSPPSWVRA